MQIPVSLKGKRVSEFQREFSRRFTKFAVRFVMILADAW